MKLNILFKLLITGLFITGCNNTGKKDEQKIPATDSADLKSSPAPASVQYNKEVTYGKYKFTVTTQGEADDHHFKIIPQGLTEVNDTLSEDVKGTISDVIIDDIDGDNSPEVAVIDIYGPYKQGHVHIFSTNNGKSIGLVNMPEIPEGDKSLIGYKGYDEYNFVENSFIRRFPVYEGDNKTAKMRQLQYKLKNGEAMKQLVLDKVVDF